MSDTSTPITNAGSDRAQAPASSTTAKINQPTTHDLPAGGSQLGAQLEPVLLQVCNGRLKDISWFRTDWQRGGAATGFATYLDDDECAQPVVVKLPVKPVERRWLNLLQSSKDVAPKMFACGEEIGGYDIAWVVMERLGHGPLGRAWGGAAFDLAIEAVGRFYAAAESVAVDGEPPRKDWEKILETARQKVRRHAVDDEQRWGTALKKAKKKLKKWLDVWRDRPIDQWCHGDLHLGNAMSRSEAPNGPAILLDYAEVHPGNWIEDAVYFEHLYWSRRDMLDGRKICSAMAKQRKERGLPVDPNWPRIASVRRALLAMSTPAMLEHDGDRKHVAATLEVLEREVG